MNFYSTTGTSDKMLYLIIGFLLALCLCLASGYGYETTSAQKQVIEVQLQMPKFISVDASLSGSVNNRVSGSITSY